MDLNTAFRMFMERTRMVRGLPFPAVLPKENPFSARTKEEFCASVGRGIAQTDEGYVQDADEAIEEISKELGLS